MTQDRPTMFDIYSLVENAHEAINEGEIEEAKSILSALKNSLEPYAVMRTIQKEDVHPSIRHESWKHGDPRFDPNARG